MTRRLCLSLAALCLGGAASCVDLTEHPVSEITSAYLATPAGFEAAVNAMYTPLRSFWPLERGATMTVFGTDEYDKGADGSYKFFNDYNSLLNGDVDFLRDTWFDFYKGINTANTVIAAAATSNLPDATKNTRLGEAKFLRALYYFTLVRTFGDIPLYTEPTPGVTNETNREPVAKVYDLIIKDLLEAETALPDKAAQFGRADKPAVQHLLGEVYLTRAGSATSSPYFALAAAKLTAVATNPRFSLLKSYKDIWRIDNEVNSEVVFSIQFTADPLTTGSGNKLHLYWGYPYDQEPGMKRDIANDRPFKRWRQTKWLLALWNRSIDSRYEDMHKFVWYSNNAATIPKVNGVPKFTEGDTAVFFPSLPTIPPAMRAATRYKLYGEDEYNDATFPVLIKYLDPTRTATNQEEGQRDHPLFRLANTYLMLAEALIRDGKVPEGLVWLNKVRTRAAKPGQEAAMQATAADLAQTSSGSPAPLDFILDERARELTGETTRWFDLTRTGQLVARVQKWNPGGRANIKPEHMLRPIPNVEILNSTGNMKQNPGY